MSPARRGSDLWDRDALRNGGSRSILSWGIDESKNLDEELREVRPDFNGSSECGMAEILAMALPMLGTTCFLFCFVGCAEVPEAFSVLPLDASGEPGAPVEPCSASVLFKFHNRMSI
jgi:hypothetical protein